VNIKKHIPNAITCGNLLCGCLAIVSIFNGNMVWSAYLVGIAAVLDFFDGFVARLLKVGGEMGKQLDSLADMVTFGAVPGFVVFELIRTSFRQDMLKNISFSESVPIPNFYLAALFIPVLIPIFSALRLAKFNIDTRQSSSFIGVPTPANAMLICSLPLINYFQPILLGYKVSDITANVYFLVALTVIMSYLMVAELPLFALKFKNFSWTDNKIRYIYLISSLLLLIVFHFIAIPIIIFLYIVLSIINNTITKNEI
jgi:CDP-diacylglycerol--serine O-phosphatidyltransferase